MVLVLTGCIAAHVQTYVRTVEGAIAQRGCERRVDLPQNVVDIAVRHLAEVRWGCLRTTLLIRLRVGRVGRALVLWWANER